MTSTGLILLLIRKWLEGGKNMKDRDLTDKEIKNSSDADIEK